MKKIGGGDRAKERKELGNPANGLQLKVCKWSTKELTDKIINIPL